MFEFDNAFDLIIFIIEIIGCLSFGTSGAIKAIRSKTDILGVWVLTLFEAFGGGLIRDLIISEYPPFIIWNKEYHLLALVIIVVSLVWFIIAYNKKTAHFIEKHRHDRWIYYVDAVGIAAFCVAGCQIAQKWVPAGAGTIGTHVFVVTLGVVTGVGGGMLRDVIMGRIPSVFQKHFYMTPCIIGCLIHSIMIFIGAEYIISSIVCFSIIIILRFLAIKFEWNLPIAKGYNELIESIDKDKTR